MKIFARFFLILSLVSCSTIEFGIKTNLLDVEEKKLDVREYNLKYQYKVIGILVKGEKSVVEDFFIHPDNTTHFIFISFPKVGILKTEDNGETFKTNFFRISSLDRYFGYNVSDEDEKINDSKGNDKQTAGDRVIIKFRYSKNDENKILLLVGDYIFLSTDKGDSWKYKRLFYDTDRSQIIDAIITNDDKIICFSQNKISFSDDWGNKWKSNQIKIDGFNFFNTKFIDCIYDQSNDIILSSFINSDESNAVLSQSSFDFFYNKKESVLYSGVYYSEDLGKNWKKTAISVPVMFWGGIDGNYGSPIFPISMYNHQFSDNFKKDVLFKEAVFKSLKKTHNEYVDYLIGSLPERISILSCEQNRILKINNQSEIEWLDETNFDNIYLGIKKSQEFSFVLFNKNYYEEKKSNNFFYEYNPNYMFKKWTGMRTNDPVIYTRDESGDYYRLLPNSKFWEVFVKYSVENQVRLNNINPFLKKTTDIEFFDPSLDPTFGFPVIIQKSTDKGQTWSDCADTVYIRNIVDPLGNKRSGFYWHKNVEQKKNIKLQFSFGFDQGVSYFQYPHKLEFVNNELYIILNYFTLRNSYKDLYIIPVK